MDRPYSLYDVLNVSPGASPAALEAAYRSLMKRHHPDRTGAGAGSRAAEINAAFAVLRDPDQRQDYDRREGARQRALLDQQLHRLHRRRRLAGWGAWSAAALVLCAATAYAAQNIAVRALAKGSIAVAALPDEPAPARLDPVRVVNEVLAEAAEMSLGPRATPQKGPVRLTVAGPPAARAAAIERRPALLRRRAAAAAAAEPRHGRGEAEGDFLEREGFIY